jgi:hypothetical protein
MPERNIWPQRFIDQFVITRKQLNQNNKKFIYNHLALFPPEKGLLFIFKTKLFEDKWSLQKELNKNYEPKYYPKIRNDGATFTNPSDKI